VKGLAKDEEARVAKFNEGRGEKRPAPSVAEIASAAAAAAVSRPEAKARKVEVDDQISFVLELYDPAEEQKEAASEDEKVCLLPSSLVLPHLNLIHTCCRRPASTAPRTEERSWRPQTE
jgi:hypothetical protein